MAVPAADRDAVPTKGLVADFVLRATSDETRTKASSVSAAQYTFPAFDTETVAEAWGRLSTVSTRGEVSNCGYRDRKE